MRSVLVALLIILGLSSARADIQYTVFPFELFGTSGDAHLTGTIITDGALGAITPADIVSAQFTDMETSGYLDGQTFTASGGGSWTPGSVTATAGGLVFDFGAGFTNSVSFPMLQFSPVTCGPLGMQCGNERIGLETQIMTPQLGARQFIGLAGGGSVVVPSPVLGAGLPGLMLTGLLSWLRRKRFAIMAAH